MYPKSGIIHMWGVREIREVKGQMSCVLRQKAIVPSDDHDLEELKQAVRRGEDS